MFSRKLNVSTFIAVAAALSLAAAARAAPEPEFSLVEEGDGFEIRDYPELVIAKTPSGDGENAAFRRLFQYISGANEGAREVSMTAPVLVAEGTEISMTAPVLGATGRDGSGGEEMAFILPAEFTRETAPIPTDPQVSIAVIPARRVAAATFSGWADDEDFAEAEAELRARLSAADYAATDAVETAQYDPPWTLGPFRRNEVLITIRVD
ncbi:MAG: heme-binding protein [Pseudomonadota bacterium]